MPELKPFIPIYTDGEPLFKPGEKLEPYLGILLPPTYNPPRLEPDGLFFTPTIKEPPRSVGLSVQSLEDAITYFIGEFRASARAARPPSIWRLLNPRERVYRIYLIRELTRRGKKSYRVRNYIYRFNLHRNRRRA